MARVAVPEEQWLQFRALAITKKRSIAAYLGHLVQRELGRAARVERRRANRREVEEGAYSDVELEEGPYEEA